MEIFVAVLLFVIIVLAVLAYLSYRTAFYVPKKRRTLDPTYLPPAEKYDHLRDTMKMLVGEMQDSTVEYCRIKALDGTSLHARYYHVKDGAPVVIFFHGYRSGPLHDACGSFRIFKGAGYNFLAVDHRSHGESEGGVISFGIKERFDALSWANFVIEHNGKDTPIILCGISMGGATVLMASDLDLPKNVVGIISDCPYSSPKDILKTVIRSCHVPASVIYPLMKFSMKLRHHIDLEESSATSSVANSTLPILIIHGEADSFVPFKMSEKILNAANDNVDLQPFPGADHGMSYFSDGFRYEKLVLAFADKYTNQSK